MDPATGQIVHSIPCHGDRAHGIAWDPIDASLWSIDSNKRVIYKLNPFTGQILDAVGCSGPEPHGMTIRDGNFWICDAETRQVYTVPCPGAADSPDRLSPSPARARAAMAPIWSGLFPL
jgi:streptogramin lyase